MKGGSVALGSEYRRIWFGSAASNLADGIAFVALPLLGAALTNDPLAIAGLSVAYTVPRILAALGIGVLVDRADRRRLLYASNFARAIVFATLAVLVLVGAAPMVVLYLVFACLGLFESVSDNAAFAVLPQAVPTANLDRANSQIAGTQLVIDEFVGPPLGGLLFGIAAFLPSALNAVAFLLAGMSFFALRGSYSSFADPALPRATVRADIREGAVWVWRHPVVRSLVLIGTIASVAYMIPFSYLVLYATRVLRLDATGYGVLLSVSAIGGLIGTSVAGRLRRRLGYGWSIVGALALGSGSFVVIALSSNLVVVGLALAAYIGHAAVWNVLASSVRQRATPTALMGRVGSVSRLLGLTGLAAGALAGGGLAGAFGLQFPFVVAGGLFALAAAICALSMRHFRSWERAQVAV